MSEFDISDLDIRALQDWLRTAWQRLGDPGLTPYMRQELRNQMKQHSADLRAQLQAAVAPRPQPAERATTSRFSKPELRILR